MSSARFLTREDPRAVHAASANDVEARVLAVLRSGSWVGGPVVAEAEAALAQRFGVACAVGLNSGTDALVLGLQAMGIGPGDEVIVPGLTFVCTAGTAVARGSPSSLRPGSPNADQQDTSYCF